MDKNETLQAIRLQEEKGKALAARLQAETDFSALEGVIDDVLTWCDLTGATLAKRIPEDNRREFGSSRNFDVPRVSPSKQERLQWIRETLKRKLRVLSSLAERVEANLIVLEDLHEASPIPAESARAGNPSVFLVHGHNALLQLEVEKFLNGVDKVGEVIVLADQPNLGRTLVEKFEEHASVAGYAVVLLTGDDEARPLWESETGGREPPLVRRARQNVIFELGYFYAKLGRDRVAVLYEADVEFPSDINGIAYISFRDDWKEKLRTEIGALN